MFADRPDGKHAKPPPGLYLIATPLGNLGDISARAVRLLQTLDLLACEDTRTTRRLCAALGIAAPKLVRYDDHADEAARAQLVAAIQAGQAVGLVCDAGTPLIADPGYRLVRAVRAAGLPVTAAPGPAAAITALILSGLPSDRFLFAGFTPRGVGARRSWLDEIKAIKATLVIYESPHRLVDSLADMAAAFGARDAAVARELTKTFEEVRTGSLAELAAHYAEAGAPKGEIVVVIGPPGEGAAAPADETPHDVEALLRAALAAGSLRDAVASVARATGLPRREVYRRALALGAKG